MRKQARAVPPDEIIPSGRLPILYSKKQETREARHLTPAVIDAKVSLSAPAWFPPKINFHNQIQRINLITNSWDEKLEKL